MLKELNSEEAQLYFNQIKVDQIGVEGQQKLKASSVGVIGAGGLGCAVLPYLTAAGIGTIGIIDDDVIEMKNLQRQVLYGHQDLEKNKCVVAKEKLAYINPHVHLESDLRKICDSNAEKIIAKYDVIVDATDNAAARYAINDACVKQRKPFVYGSINRFEGQVAIFNHDVSYSCYRSLFPLPLDCPSCASNGVIAAMPGIVGCIQAMETLKLILGLNDTLTGKLLRFNALTWSCKVYHL